VLNAVVPEQVLPSAPFEGRMWAASERGNGGWCAERDVWRRVLHMRRQARGTGITFGA